MSVWLFINTKTIKSCVVLVSASRSATKDEVKLQSQLKMLINVCYTRVNECALTGINIWFGLF